MQGAAVVQNTCVQGVPLCEGAAVVQSAHTRGAQERLVRGGGHCAKHAHAWGARALCAGGGRCAKHAHAWGTRALCVRGRSSCKARTCVGHKSALHEGAAIVQSAHTCGVQERFVQGAAVVQSARAKGSPLYEVLVQRSVLVQSGRVRRPCKGTLVCEGAHGQISPAQDRPRGPSLVQEGATAR